MCDSAFEEAIWPTEYRKTRRSQSAIVDARADPEPKCKQSVRASGREQEQGRASAAELNIPAESGFCGRTRSHEEVNCRKTRKSC